MSTIIVGKSIPVMQNIYFDATYHLSKIFTFMQKIFILMQNITLMQNIYFDAKYYLCKLFIFMQNSIYVKYL